MSKKTPGLSLSCYRAINGVNISWAFLASGSCRGIFSVTLENEERTFWIRKALDHTGKGTESWVGKGLSMNQRTALSWEQLQRGRKAQGPAWKCTGLGSSLLRGKIKPPECLSEVAIFSWTCLMKSFLQQDQILQQVTLNFSDSLIQISGSFLRWI